jgi:hypothetical protein
MTLAIDLSRRLSAADAVLRALRTGELVAARHATSYLAPDVSFSTNGKAIAGREAVADRLTGQWSFTLVMAQGHWSEPKAVGGQVAVTGGFPGIGAAPEGYQIAFSFDADDRIVEIAETYAFPRAGAPAADMPDHVRAAIDRALVNGTPIVLGYVDASGQPSLSPRGSLQSYSGTELCMWVRDANSGLIAAVKAGRPLGLLYRESRTRTTLSMKGIGRIADDPATSEQVFRMAPEVEQRHDPGRAGVAMIIRLTEVAGTSPYGAVLVKPQQV